MLAVLSDSLWSSASKTVWGYICVVLSHKVCNNQLEQQQGTNIMQYVSFILALDYKFFEYWNNLSINSSTVLNIITLSIYKSKCLGMSYMF